MYKIVFDSDENIYLLTDGTLKPVFKSGDLDRVFLFCWHNGIPKSDVVMCN